MTVAIVEAARELVALWDAERVAQCDPDGATSYPPKPVLAAARRKLREAVRGG